MKLRYLIYTLFFMLICSTVQAQPTDITIHVKAKGSKFIGSSMGGARIVLKDAITGKILKEGKTAGSTGDTERIMKSKLKSTQPLSTENTAKYETTINIETPTLIEVEAYGPQASLQSRLKASARQWVIPGKDITEGDAFLLVLQGMAVGILSPVVSSSFEPGSKIEIVTNITMSCGCPVAPNGLWDSNDMEIKGMVSKEGRHVTDIDLSYAGKLSQFTGHINVSENGVYEIFVYAYDSENGNTGLDRTAFTISK